MPAANQYQYRSIAYASILIRTYFVIIFLARTKEPRWKQHNAHICHENISWAKWIKKFLYYQVAAVYTLVYLATNVSQALLTYFLINDLQIAESSQALLHAVIYIFSFVVSIDLHKMEWSGVRLKVVYTSGAILWIFCGAGIVFLPSSMNQFMYLLSVIIVIANEWRFWNDLLIELADFDYFSGAFLGNEVGLVLESTNFYDDQDGQIYATGSIENSAGLCQVINVQVYGSFILYFGYVLERVVFSLWEIKLLLITNLEDTRREEEHADACTTCLIVSSALCVGDRQLRENEQRTKGDQSDLHVIIFDEIDAICKSRGSTRNGTGVHDSIVNQLLAKIDGIESLNNVLLIGMTNWKDRILQIFKIHTNKVKENSFISPDVDILELAARTKNYSGAELERVVKSVVSYALNRQLSLDDLTKPVDDESIKVTMDYFLLALQKVVAAFGASTHDLARCRLNGMVALQKVVAAFVSKQRSVIFCSDCYVPHANSTLF